MARQPIPPAEHPALGYEAYGMRIPDRMARKMDEYLESGGPLGDFLTAVFSNNFSEACFHADPENAAIIRVYAFYLYNEAPAPAWGSAEKMDAWRARFEPTATEAAP